MPSSQSEKFNKLYEKHGKKSKNKRNEKGMKIKRGETEKGMIEKFKIVLFCVPNVLKKKMVPIWIFFFFIFGKFSRKLDCGNELSDWDSGGW